MKERSVRIILADEFNDAVNGVHSVAAAKEGQVEYAIGRLLEWVIGSARYSMVVIMGDTEGNLTAYYHDDKGVQTFVIGAILRDNGEYTFHS